MRLGLGCGSLLEWIFLILCGGWFSGLILGGLVVLVCLVGLFNFDFWFALCVCLLIRIVVVVVGLMGLVVNSVALVAILSLFFYCVWWVLRVVMLLIVYLCGCLRR